MGLDAGRSTYIREMGDMEVCTSMLVNIEEGRKVEAINFENNCAVYTLGQAVNDDGDMVEMLDNRIIFTLIGNYCAYLAKNAYADKFIAEFLQWLFREKSGVLQMCLVSSRNVVPKNVLEQITPEKIDVIKLKTKNNDETKGTRNSFFNCFGRDVSTSPTQDDWDVESLESATNKIQMETVLKCTDKNSIRARELMVDMAIDLLQNEPAHTIVHLTNKNIITAHEVIIKGKLSLPKVNGHEPVLDAMNGISSWLTTKMEEHNLK